MRNKIKRFILWLLIPIQKLLQRLGRQEALINDNEVEIILDIAEPGDILVCSEQGRPTSITIPGEYDHVAIFDNRMMIIDAVGDKFVKDPVTGEKKNIGGVRENKAEKWLYQMKRVALIRPKASFEIRKRVSLISRGYIGTSYDYYFEYGSEKIYCSELPYLCYVTEIKNFLANEPVDKEILPQRYRDLCGTQFELIYETEQK